MIRNILKLWVLNINNRSILTLKKNLIIDTPILFAGYIFEKIVPNNYVCFRFEVEYQTSCYVNKKWLLDIKKVRFYRLIGIIKVNERHLSSFAGVHSYIWKRAFHYIYISIFLYLKINERGIYLKIPESDLLKL